MAIRAAVQAHSFYVDEGDNTKMQCLARVMVFGSDIGTLGNATYDLAITDLTAGTLGTVNANIADAVESDLIAHEVPYTQLLDSVWVY